MVVITNFTNDVDYLFDDKEDFYTNIDYTLPDSVDFLEKEARHDNPFAVLFDQIFIGIGSLYTYEGQKLYGLLLQALLLTVTFVSFAFTNLPRYETFFSGLMLKTVMCPISCVINFSLFDFTCPRGLMDRASVWDTRVCEVKLHLKQRE